VRLIQGWRANRAYLSHPTRAAPRGDPRTLATLCHAYSVKKAALSQASGVKSAVAYARATAAAGSAFDLPVLKTRCKVHCAV
jgi:hypothetical protein